MGCWNKTCGLSGLPIFANEPVVVVVMQKNNGNDRSYSSAFWKPIFMPIYAKYNDYGGGQEVHGIGVDIILNGLKERLVEKEVGENQYHDIAVKKDDLTIDKFFEYVHEGRLEVRDMFGEESLVDFVMIKQSLFDDVLNNFKFTDYVGDGKGNSGSDNCYMEYGFAEVLKDLPLWIAKAREYQFLTPSSFRDVVSFDDDLSSGRFLKSHIGGVGLESSIGDIGIQIMKAVSDDPDAAHELLSESLKLRYLNAFMDGIRKSWMPGGYEGSQETDYDGYKFLAGAMLKEMEFDFLEREEAAEEEEYENSLR